MMNYHCDKLNALIVLNNQRKHYRRILQAKKSIDFNQLTNHPNKTLSSLSTKYTNNRQRQRQQSNMKLVQKIKQIRSNEGVLQKVEKDARRLQKLQKLQKKQKLKRKQKLQRRKENYESNKAKSKCNRSLNDCWDNKLRINSQIEVQNERMANKLKSVKPIVGTKRQWKEHFDSFRVRQKKLRRYSVSKEYDYDNLLRETISMFNKTQKTQHD